MASADKKSAKELSGIITDNLPNAMFKVRVDNEGDMIAYLSGKMRLNRIRVLIGDTVRVIPDEYGKRARIVRRG
ncbi:MAG: translation initiation factor IF-1 [Candidatus Vogelbacteria bacterium CG10_big_fil_rev_8_21_14_0_10_45_14]|uniref:Translation initiation factor IF-1 n=1 Tax=Candidatus Vogelbacteria bacterium CG10_big_fil_rev_8_21_14_0_10_45_14 TaxID=1975042 RepID=A0A2H0RL43_9BACT|nr:MAG: translation initiation factor IF-1 [Candidatus Vogelbacteria bacterium CG10_big_fil_rev_8_21_14_0_10_45_14]